MEKKEFKSKIKSLLDNNEILKEHFREIEANPDGEAKCYEFTREILECYKEAKNSGKSLCKKDIDLLCNAGKFDIKIKDPKKIEEYIKNSPILEKREDLQERLTKKYYDISKDSTGRQFGLFGGRATLFSNQFKDNEKDMAKKFIDACIDINDIDDNDEKIFEQFKFMEDWKSGKAGTISQILHCIKPKIFPIVNGNVGKGNLFKTYNKFCEGGHEIKKLGETNNYIENCRKIKKLREEFGKEFGVEYNNYRIYDIIAKHIDFEEAPLNRILYGPPGTGKTYNTIVKAMEIIDGVNYNDIPDEDYKLLKEGFNEELGKRIEFITFHQSYAYEEFIEGIKPYIPEWGEKNAQDVKYVGKDGIFKKFAKKALFNMLNIDDKYKKSYTQFEDLKEKFIEEYDMSVPLETKNGKEFYILNYSENNLQIKPDKGETNYSLSFEYIRKFVKEFEQRDIESITRKDLCRLIPATAGLASYYLPIVKEFLGLRKSNTIENHSMKVEETEDFKENAIKDYYKDNIKLKEKNEDVDSYVLIIDEINRGNISKIFGELITLIEDDKRTGNSNTLTATLPYSGEKFTIPKNLYIIGTMNTADRSIDLLDTALRRRFTFEEKMPDSSLLSNEKIKIDDKDKPFSPKEFLEEINKKICQYDRNHQIGHAYLMGVETEEDFMFIFKNKIYPLLQEYFYNDEVAIDEVLGKYKTLKGK